MTKTYTARPSEIERKWYVIDADGIVLGRLASEVAMLLRGKNKPTFTPNIDTGDFVVVINAEKIRVTGKKVTDKEYKSHSGYPGGLKTQTLGEMSNKYPARVIEKAVWGMLPKGSLGRAQLRKLKVVCGSKNPHEAQKPEPYTLKYTCKAEV